MPTEKEQKMKIIEDAITSIEKTYGKGSIMKLGDGVIHDIEAIPTGALSLDYALGIGGFPRGRVTEVYGPESSGKTTLCLHVIAEAQKLGGLAAFIDAEHALDVNYAKRLGVDTANLLISQPDFGEQVADGSRGPEAGDEFIAAIGPEGIILIGEGLFAAVDFTA